MHTICTMEAIYHVLTWTLRKAMQKSHGMTYLSCASSHHMPIGYSQNRPLISWYSQQYRHENGLSCLVLQDSFPNPKPIVYKYSTLNPSFQFLHTWNSYNIHITNHGIEVVRGIHSAQNASIWEIDLQWTNAHSRRRERRIWIC